MTQGFVDWKGKMIDKVKHGGVRASYFVNFMAVMTNMANVPNILNLVVYLHGVMHMGVARSSTTVTNFIGGTCAFTLVGAWISDSYITRFKTILMFGSFEFLGYALLSLQAYVPSLHPPNCDTNGNLSDCVEVHGPNAALLFVAIYSIALGEGCIRACLASFGGDQFDSDDTVEKQQKSSFFNWYTFGISFGSIAGMLLIVWIENYKGWEIGFAVSALLVLIGEVVMAVGFSFYRLHIPEGSPLTRILKVFVVAIRNRKLELPADFDGSLAHENHGGVEVLRHTEGLKFLDKATLRSGNTGSWSSCTINQVEEAKILLQMLPIFISSALAYVPVPLFLTFVVQQGGTMNRSLGKIHISPASLLIISGMLQSVILVLYDRFFVPIMQNITGYVSGVTHLQRVGVGNVALVLGTAAAALVEMKRKSMVIDNGLEGSDSAVPLSVFWLSWPLLFLSINDSTTFVGLLEFFNSEVPKGMKSMGTAIFWCMIGLSSLMGSLIIQIVNDVSSHYSGRGWLEGHNLNNTHLDRFYWLLSAFGAFAFCNYLYWARRYIYKQNPCMTSTS